MKVKNTSSSNDGSPRLVKLGTICDITTGKSNVDEAVERGKYAFFDRSKIVKRSSRYLLDVEALIVAGEGKEFLPKYFNGKFDLHQRAYALYSFKPCADIQYVYWYLIHVHKYFENVAVGTTVKSLRLRHFADLTIQLPPLAEQKRIVGVFDEVFAGAGEAKRIAEKNLANARELFESCLQKAFTVSGGDCGDRSLGEIAEFRNGINFTKNSKGELIKIVGVKDFKNHFDVQFDGLSEVRVDGALSDNDSLRKGDILAVRSNGNPALIGRTLLVGSPLEKTSYSGFTIRIRADEKKMSPAYLCNFLKSAAVRRQLTSGGIGTNIKSLNQPMLAELRIPCPPLPTQRAIVAKLDALSEQTKKLEAIYKQKLADLEELKKSVLKKAFAGEL